MKIEVEPEIVQQVKKHFPEVQRMTATGVVDWALRLLVAGKLTSDILPSKGVSVIMEKRNLEE